MRPDVYGGSAGYAAATSMLAIVRGPERRYFTLPVVSANSVKSRPMPTFEPGMNHGADLADQDVAREHDLAGVALDRRGAATASRGRCGRYLDLFCVPSLYLVLRRLRGSR